MVMVPPLFQISLLYPESAVFPINLVPKRLTVIEEPFSQMEIAPLQS